MSNETPRDSNQGMETTTEGPGTVLVELILREYTPIAPPTRQQIAAAYVANLINARGTGRRRYALAPSDGI